MSPDVNAVAGSSIIDNRNENTLLAAIKSISDGGRELWIASGYFSMDGLVLLADAVEQFDRVRILFGDDSSRTERKALLENLQKVSAPLLLEERESLPLLTPLQKVEAAFVAGKIEARCYTADKFHAKAYVFQRPDIYPNRMGIIGSGNFTRPGLTKNIELNVELTPEQTAQLEDWFNERWNEAVQDVVTDDLLAEVRRHIELYDPYIIYLKALMLWGEYVQGDAEPAKGVSVYDLLDPHQQHAYKQALRIIERNSGVMVCDGVGLGKSYIALALMEKFCRDGERVLLLAPKSILESSWEQYLDDYLGDYKEPFGAFRARPMTDLGFPPEGETNGEETREQTARKRKEIKKLHQRATVIVVDESHNFRSTAAARYKNLAMISAPFDGKRKKIVLLTATPVNNLFRDISSQLALITQENGSIGGYQGQQITKLANRLDKDKQKVLDIEPTQGVLEIFKGPEQELERSLRQVLEQVVIQRTRETCKQQSEAEGRPIHFPIRLGPEVIEYAIGDAASELSEALTLAEKRFRPFVYLLNKMQEVSAEVSDGEGTKAIDAAVLLSAASKKYKGLKLAAFLPEQYSKSPKPGQKNYQDEVRLAGLVYANTLKQLESSLPAFQGILQSLATGLIARLEYILGDKARTLTEPHLAWAMTKIFDTPMIDEGQLPDLDIEDDGENLDVSGNEADEWINKAIRTRKLDRKLAGYDDSNFYVDKWRDDIVLDLKYLQEIHQEVMEAREHDDPKLEQLLPKVKTCLEGGHKVLVFTQSQRTAEYLEREFKGRLKEWKTARIDSRVETTRAAILHAFCPGYNPHTSSHPSIPEKIDVLVSTDVLSEGVNLQEAGAIFNWDIHWNPVRLIQRIGRVDRRLDPKISKLDHSFTIYNVLPPKEIEGIIKLVNTVEGRTLNISRAVGVDLPFFKADDPAYNLKEFNAYYEGTPNASDDALTSYIKLVNQPPEKWKPTLDALPAGAFGVWDKAPFNGLFALFTMEATEKATDAVKEKFASVIGRPVLAIQADAQDILEAGAALQVLADTVEGQPSGNPSDEQALAAKLKSVKDKVRQQFGTIGLPGTILPRLVCWMEMKKG